ncbi:MAG: hypothetical protein FVQ85_16735 [Planctomycetes bacterium]|nr:hypothetical protein [Planctomycetota bacterium]
MKGIFVSKFRNCLSIFVLAAIVVAIVACDQQVKEKQEQPLLLEEKPLLLEDPPLLLEDEPAGPVADNSRCHVCHINYEDEVLAVTHARANISCEHCHGASDAHCGDEDNITPPDIMYPAAKIGAFCMHCHTMEKIDIAVHKEVLSKIESKEVICTNCHGEHRLGYRTRKWDKTTGKLIEDDKVRMTDKPNE